MEYPQPFDSSIEYALIEARNLARSKYEGDSENAMGVRVINFLDALDTAFQTGKSVNVKNEKCVAGRGNLSRINQGLIEKGSAEAGERILAGIEDRLLWSDISI